MNLPSDFILRTRELLGDAEFAALTEALEKDTPVSIRMNTDKCGLVPQEGTSVPGVAKDITCPVVRRLRLTPCFMRAAIMCRKLRPCSWNRRYVSMCTGRHDARFVRGSGRKIYLARSILPEGSLLVANEVMRNRSQVLAENLIKWGNPGVIVTNNDPADFTELGPLFDVILTDVPCSGEGMFRKDEVAVQEWSIENVDTCWQRQRRILRDIWPCLKTGGLLIYSTCTYNREENEDNVAWIAQELGAEVLPLETQPDWCITGNLTGTEFPVYRFLPHKTTGEGLFMAVLRKTADEPAVSVRTKTGGKASKKGKGGKVVALQVPKEMKAWVQGAGDYVFEVNDSEAMAFPAAYKDTYDLLKSQLRILHAGISLGELKGKDWQPSHALAMSTVFERDSFPMLN